MALELTTGITPEWYTPDSEKDQKNPMRFKIRPLGPDEIMEFRGEQNGGRRLTYAFNRAVIDWEGVYVDGEPLPCNMQNVSKIPSYVKAQAGARVVEISEETEEQKKIS